MGDCVSIHASFPLAYKQGGSKSFAVIWFGWCVVMTHGSLRADDFDQHTSHSRPPATASLVINSEG